MANEVFWDTSGLFALLNKTDQHHRQASELVRHQREVRRALLTTDAVIGECCTLLVTRGKSHLVNRFLDLTERSASMRVVHLDRPLVAATKQFFRRHLDHRYSFIDCSSFVVMEANDLLDAATADAHFVEAGFRALLRAS